MKGSDDLLRLADDIGRLRPDWCNHERYFEERDALQKRARRIALRLREEEGC
jgi:hypothetical protein